MNKNLREFTVRGIALNEESGLPVIFLKGTDDNIVLPLNIGPSEASAIIVEMEDIHPPRPMTHDVISEFLRKHKFFLKSIVIYEVINDEYLARMEYSRGFHDYTMELRPSDGIALALRMNAPILISRNVEISLERVTSPVEIPAEYNNKILFFEPDNADAHLM